MQHVSAIKIGQVVQHSAKMMQAENMEHSNI